MRARMSSNRCEGVKSFSLELVLAPQLGGRISHNRANLRQMSDLRYHL